MLTIISCYSDCAPSYVKELITPYQPIYSGLRSSSDSRMLTKPKTNLKSSSKGFHSAAPNLWNGLPYVIRHAVSLKQFKSLLKTHLF